MTSLEILEQRRAQALADAVGFVRESKPDTQRLDAVMADPTVSFQDQIVTLLAELAETVVRQERAINHLGDHVVPNQDVRLEKLEKAGEKGTTKKG